MVAQRLVDPEDRRKKTEAEAVLAFSEIQVAEAKVELAKARKDPVAEAKAEVELAKARKDFPAVAMGTCLFQHLPVVMCSAFACSRAVLSDLRCVTRPLTLPFVSWHVVFPHSSPSTPTTLVVGVDVFMCELRITSLLSLRSFGTL